MPEAGKYFPNAYTAWKVGINCILFIDPFDGSGSEDKP